MGRKQLHVAVAALGVLGGTAVLAEEQKATGVVAVRQATMKANGDHMTAIKAILTEYPQLLGQIEFHADAIKETAEYTPAMFPAGQRPAADLGPAAGLDASGRVQGGGREGRGPGREAGRCRQGRRCQGDAGGLRDPRQGRLRRLPRDLPQEGQLRLAVSGRRRWRWRRWSLRRRPHAAADPDAAAPGRADLPYRRLHQLPHRQGRRAAGRRRRDRQPVRQLSTRPTSRPTRQPGSAAGARPTSSGRCARASVPRAGRYYPAFPYTSFTHMTDEDLTALKAYLDTLPPVSQPSRPHELWFPFNLRWGMLALAVGLLRAGAVPARPGAATPPGTGAPTSCSARAIAPSATRRAPSTACSSRTTPLPARSSARRRCPTSPATPTKGLGKWSAATSGPC